MIGSDDQVVLELPGWVHANLQAGVDAYLATFSPDAHDLPLALHPRDPMIVETEGVTAPFMREVVHARAGSCAWSLMGVVVDGLCRGLAADPGVPVALDGELLGATLVELSDERPALIRALPGG